VSDCSLVPRATADPADARTIYATDGAVIVEGIGPSPLDAQSVVRSLFGASIVALPEPAAVEAGGEKDRSDLGSADPLPLHSDGFAYGDQAGDVLALVCVAAGDTGGQSVLVDGLALYESLDPDLRRFLAEVAVDLSEPGMRPAVATVLLTLADGRRMIRWNPFLRPAPDSADPDADRRFLTRWSDAVEAARISARRFTARVGQAIVVDNFRMLHSRDPFTGSRFMWRVWAWTDEANGVPDGMLHSDSRYAAS